MVLDRAHSGEEFVTAIQNIIFAAGDAQEASPYCAVDDLLKKFQSARETIDQPILVTRLKSVELWDQKWFC